MARSEREEGDGRDGEDAAAPVSETLFDADFDFACVGWPRENFPYFFAVGSVYHNYDPVDELEACIFHHVAEHEVAFYEPRARIAGPLRLTIEGEKVDVGASRSWLQLPTWTEDDAVAIEGSDAAGVLVFQEAGMPDRMFNAMVFRDDPFLIFTGAGIPRAGGRRFLHRLQKKLKLPVYYIADNDTWGYLGYSVLARGLLWPKRENRYLAVEDLRYLGIRAGEFHALNEPRAVRPWKEHWTLRTAAMRRYPCFASAEWQAELDAFESRRTATSAAWAMETLGEEGFREYLLYQIENRRWIDRAPQRA